MVEKLKKLNEKQRQRLMVESQNAIRELQKKKKHKCKKHTIKTRTNKAYSHRFHNNNKKTVNMVVPQIFSITNNTNETLDFFNQVYRELKRLRYRENLFFNFANAETVTVDAIMYLIALLKNTQYIKVMQIGCSGNIPNNKEAQRVIETSGFFDYVTPQYSVQYHDRVNISISSGYGADPMLVGSVCDFVHNNSSLNRLDTKSLFPMIMELMTNVKQHAYGYKDNIKSKWYIFVENKTNQIQFVFLDTGAGIPKTIRTNFLEKIKNVADNNDAYFISSALKGAYRTETKEEHRGKGMPEIYNRVSEKTISDFSIVSCGGRCDVKNDGTIIETKLSSELMGTLFYWNLNKNRKDDKI